MSRTTRARAIEGLHAIARLEEYVADEIDGPDDWRLLAERLRLSASRRRDTARRLEESDPSRQPRQPRLRLVGARCDHANEQEAS
jgi:hypothetical protein